MPEISAEPQAPERTEYPLEVDYQEVADYAHNPRCYYWTSWLGLRPPITRKEFFEQLLRENLHGWYEKTPMDLTVQVAPSDDWRNAPRLNQASAAYVRHPTPWDRLQGRTYFSRPLGSNLSYGGLLEASVLVSGALWFVIHKISEHRTDSDAFIDRFKGSPEMIGLHWLGQHAHRLMRDEFPVGRYGGIILDGIQITKTIDRRVSTFLTPSQWQVEQFVRNAYVMGEEIVRRRELTRKHIEAEEPARNAWPNWPTSGEHFCPWKALNLKENSLQENMFLSACTTDPWWIRREG